MKRVCLLITLFTPVFSFTQTAKHITNQVAKNKVMYLSKTDAIYKLRLELLPTLK